MKLKQKIWRLKSGADSNHAKWSDGKPYMGSNSAGRHSETVPYSTAGRTPGCMTDSKMALYMAAKKPQSTPTGLSWSQGVNAWLSCYITSYEWFSWIRFYLKQSFRPGWITFTLGKWKWLPLVIGEQRWKMRFLATNEFLNPIHRGHHERKSPSPGHSKD